MTCTLSKSQAMKIYVLKFLLKMSTEEDKVRRSGEHEGLLAEATTVPYLFSCILTTF